MLVKVLFVKEQLSAYLFLDNVLFAQYFPLYVLYIRKIPFS